MRCRITFLSASFRFPVIFRGTVPFVCVVSDRPTALFPPSFSLVAAVVGIVAGIVAVVVVIGVVIVIVVAVVTGLKVQMRLARAQR